MLTFLSSLTTCPMTPFLPRPWRVTPARRRKSCVASIFAALSMLLWDKSSATFTYLYSSLYSSPSFSLSIMLALGASSTSFASGRSKRAASPFFLAFFFAPYPSISFPVDSLILLSPPPPPLSAAPSLAVWLLTSSSQRLLLNSKALSRLVFLRSIFTSSADASSLDRALISFILLFAL